MAVEHIIVADPCPDNRDSLAELLLIHGFTVEVAESLDSLLSLVKATHADLVVTEAFGDITRTCSAIRAADPDLPIAFHTTRTEPADVRRCASMGCPHFAKASETERLLGWLDTAPPRFEGRSASDDRPGSDPRGSQWLCLI